MKVLYSIWEFLNDKSFSVPLGQLVVFVVINSFCLLFGRYKLGLLLTYCFVFYWGFLFNKDYFVDMLGNTNWGLYLYAISGIAMSVTAIVGFFQESKD
ncbi:MAG: hypothetical protein HZA00_08355 [Nitrospinae bacterium]|nr:hypothetical protein [Nitrospinota bacterium]